MNISFANKKERKAFNLLTSTITAEKLRLILNQNGSKSNCFNVASTLHHEKNVLSSYSQADTLPRNLEYQVDDITLFPEDIARVNSTNGRR